SLHMDKGKVAAQCMHAMRIASSNINNIDIWNRWEFSGAKTVTLKAKDEKEMSMLLENYEGIRVYDAGCTQVPPNSFTVCMMFPMVAMKSGFTHKDKRYKL